MPDLTITRGRGSGEDWRYLWRTPPDLFEQLAAPFDGFDLDLCATRDDSLCLSWCPDVFANPLVYRDSVVPGEHAAGPFAGFAAWMNPPWGPRRKTFPGTGSFVDRAYQISMDYRCTVVVLVGASVDAQWWRLAARRAACTLILPRVAYVDPRTGEPQKNPPGPSSVFRFGGEPGPILLWEPGTELPGVFGSVESW